MISARGKKSTRKMTDEQREAARERMAELQAKRNQFCVVCVINIIDAEF